LCSESLKILQKAYGESTLSKTCAYEWYKAFENSIDVMDDLSRSVRLLTSTTEVNIAKVKEIVTENPHSTLRQRAAEFSISHESIRSFLTNHLDMQHVTALLVSKDKDRKKYYCSFPGF
jgi:predicted HTH transcriptional regulator